MATQKGEPFDKRQFAAGRSARDAQSTSDHYRAAAQAAILISGGAATAVLAYAASDRHPIAIGAHDLAIALLLYGGGVLSGAAMLLVLALSIEQWMVLWEKKTEETRDEKEETKVRKKAKSLQDVTKGIFVVSVLLFLLGSLVLAQSMIFLAPGRTSVPPKGSVESDPHPAAAAKGCFGE